MLLEDLQTENAVEQHRARFLLVLDPHAPQPFPHQPQPIFPLRFRVLRVLRGVCALREGMRARSGKTSGRRGVGRVERVSRRRQSGAGGVETRVGPVGKARTQQTVGGAKRRLADLVRGGGSVDRTGLIDGI